METDSGCLCFTETDCLPRLWRLTGRVADVYRIWVSFWDVEIPKINAGYVSKYSKDGWIVYVKWHANCGSEKAFTKTEKKQVSLKRRRKNEKGTNQMRALESHTGVYNSGQCGCGWEAGWYKHMLWIRREIWKQKGPRLHYFFCIFRKIL